MKIITVIVECVVNLKTFLLQKHQLKKMLKILNEHKKRNEEIEKSVNCNSCQIALQIHEVIVSKRTSKNSGKYYHPKCYEELFIY